MNQKIIISLIIILSFIIAFLFHLKYNTDYYSFIHDFTNEDGNAFRSRIYLSQPSDIKRKTPTVILIPGVSSPKELHHITAIELMKRDLCLIVIDISGNGEKIKGQPFYEDEYADLMAIFDAELSFVDYENIFLVGHSFGSGIAVDFASNYEEKISGVGGIGFDYVKGNVPNFLAGSGLYDEAFPPYDILDNFNKISDYEMQINKTYGNFSDKTAKRITFSPTANHASGLKDDIIIKEIITWIEQIRFGEVKSPIQLTARKDRYAVTFMAWGLFFVLLIMVIRLKNRFGRRFYLIWRIMLIALLAIIWLSAHFLTHVINPLHISTAGLISFFFIIIGGNLSRINFQKQSIRPTFILRSVLTIFVTLCVIISIWAILRIRLAVTYYHFSWDLIRYIPEFVLSILLMLPSHFVPGIRRFLVVSYSVSPSFHPAIWILWIMEILLPGWGVWLISTIAKKRRDSPRMHTDFHE
jgi:pimeloyl-ACP methyl ester carboxylesterase